jgi:hypothetical protein
LLLQAPRQRIQSALLHGHTPIRPRAGRSSWP